MDPRLLRLQPVLQPREWCTMKAPWPFQYFLLRCFSIKSNMRHSEAESKSMVLAQLPGPLSSSPTPLPWPLCALPHAAWAATQAYKSNLSLETSDPNQMAIQRQQSKLSFQQCLTPPLPDPGPWSSFRQLPCQSLPIGDPAAGGHDL